MNQQQLDEIDTLTDSAESDAALLYNRIGEIRQGLKDGSMTPQEAKDRLWEFRKYAASLAVLLNMMDQQLS